MGLLNEFVDYFKFCCVFFLKFFMFIWKNMREEWRGRERMNEQEGASCLLFPVSVLQIVTNSQSWAKAAAESQEPCPGLWHEWQAPRYLDHHPP